MYARVGATLLLGMSMIVGSAVAAEAGTLRCGDIISQDVVLQKDLACVGNGLRVDVPAGRTVTIDLNGHRLKGNGTGSGIGGRVEGSTNRNGALVVRNGLITGFAAAFLEVRAGDRVVENLTLQNLRVVSNGDWLFSRTKPRTLIENSTFVDSGRGGAGEEFRASMTVRNSKFVRSFIRAGDESVTYLTGNTFVQGGFDGGVFSNVYATGNTFSDCNTGILMTENFQGGVTIDDNQFVRCDVGVRLTGMVGPISVQRNNFIENTTSGMVFDQPRGKLNLTIADNRFRRNGDGLVGGGTARTEVPWSMTVARNLAIGNTGRGISVSNVIDGGGNVGRANGVAPDCVGVVCATH
jgi:hypothetical protein